VNAPVVQMSSLNAVKSPVPGVTSGTNRPTLTDALLPTFTSGEPDILTDTSEVVLSAERCAGSPAVPTDCADRAADAIVAVTMCCILTAGCISASPSGRAAVGPEVDEAAGVRRLGFLETSGVQYPPGSAG